MSVLYHLTSPPPVLPGTDAVVQEAQALQARFGGEMVFLLPSSRSPTSFPRPFYGLHRLRTIKRLERGVALHHLYNSELYLFPVLRLFRKAVVYTVVSGFDATPLPPVGRLERLHKIVVQSERDLATLEERGLRNACVIRPGIDVSRFRHTPLSGGGDFTVLAGSAPWTREQFRSKGVDALLQVAKQVPSLRLIFLWRGLLLHELEERVEALGLTERVEILNERVEVSSVLARAHAAIVLADWSRLVKAYPHSLIEALAAGRPVVVSKLIPMAEYVSQSRCGEVVDRLAEPQLRRAIERLREDYDVLATNALRVGQTIVVP